MNSSSRSEGRIERMFATIAEWPIYVRSLLNAGVTLISILLCLLAMPLRIPGWSLLGIGPNWILIWVVAWSINRPAWQGALAGALLGLVQDGLTAPVPSHAIGLAIVGGLTGLFQKQRYIQEDFISVALIVFGMVVVSETVMAILFIGQMELPVEQIWTYHQRITLSSAILSSLWAPIAYLPLKWWWRRLSTLERP